MILAVASLLVHLAVPSAQALPAAALAASADTQVVLKTNNNSTASQPAAPNASSAKDPNSESAPSAPAALTTASLSPTTDNSRSLSNIRITETLPEKPAPVIGVTDNVSHRNWLILSAVQHGAATFDAYATREAVSKGATEADPMMRPFAGSPAIYFAIQAGPVGLDYVARRMQRSHVSLFRRTWWIPQTASTGLFVFSGAHNLHVAGKQ